MGYFAPVEIERTEPDHGQAPVIQFLQVMQEYNVSPAELLKMVQVQPLNDGCNNAIVPPALPERSGNGTYPIKDKASNNYYVNSEDEGVDSEGKDSENQDI
jgi:hypothetical protein